MKRAILVMMLALVAMLAVGCGSVVSTIAPQATVAPVDDIDLDMTVMTETDAGAVANKMSLTPQEYMNKRIKAKGEYVCFYDEYSDEYTHELIIGYDLEGCCPATIELKFGVGYDTEDDFPAFGCDLEVIGLFNYYTDTYDGVLTANYPFLQVENMVVLLSSSVS